MKRAGKKENNLKELQSNESFLYCRKINKMSVSAEMNFMHTEIGPSQLESKEDRMPCNVMKKSHKVETFL